MGLPILSSNGDWFVNFGLKKLGWRNLHRPKIVKEKAHKPLILLIPKTVRILWLCRFCALYPWKFWVCSGFGKVSSETRNIINILVIFAVFQWFLMVSSRITAAGLQTCLQHLKWRTGFWFRVFFWNMTWTLDAWNDDMFIKGVHWVFTVFYSAFACIRTWKMK